MSLPVVAALSASCSGAMYAGVPGQDRKSSHMAFSLEAVGSANGRPRDQRTPSATIMSLSHRSVTLASAHRPSPRRSTHLVGRFERTETEGYPNVVRHDLEIHRSRVRPARSPWRAMAATFASHATIAPVSIRRRRRTGSVRQSRARSVDRDDMTERRAITHSDGRCDRRRLGRPEEPGDCCITSCTIPDSGGLPRRIIGDFFDSVC